MNINKCLCLILFILVCYSNNVEGDVTLNKLLNHLPKYAGPNFAGGAIEYCIYLQLLDAQKIISLESIPDESIQKLKKTIATALQFKGYAFFDKNYDLLLSVMNELIDKKEIMPDGISNIINENMTHENSKMIIERITKREGQNELSSECDTLLNSIINEDVQKQFIQLLENMSKENYSAKDMKSLIILYRMNTAFIPSNSSGTISFNNYKDLNDNKFQIKKAFVNEYFKNTRLAYKIFISAVQKVSIKGINEGARIEYIKLIFQEYLETLSLLSKFKQFEESVFEENSVSNFTKEFKELNKKFKDYFVKCLTDIGITEEIKLELPEFNQHPGENSSETPGENSSETPGENSSETPGENSSETPGSGKDHVKLPDKFYPVLKDLLPIVNDIMEAKALRLVINVIFNNLIEVDNNKIVELSSEYNTLHNIVPQI